MKYAILLALIFIGVNSVGMSAEAKSFTGFKRGPTSIIKEIKGAVRDVVETDTQFKILIGINAAYYNFPKDPNAVELKQVLESSQKSKKILTFKVDAVTRQIVTIEAGE